MWRTSLLCAVGLSLQVGAYKLYGFRGLHPTAGLAQCYKQEGDRHQAHASHAAGRAAKRLDTDNPHG